MMQGPQLRSPLALQNIWSWLEVPSQHLSIATLLACGHIANPDKTWTFAIMIAEYWCGIPI